jgi:hypothetical protein
VAGPPTVAEVVDLVVRMEDDAQRRISLDGFPDQFFRAAVEEELVAQDGIFVFAQIVGDAVNEGLLGYRRERAGAHLRPVGAPWTDREFQARSGYYSTLSGQQMAALFRERRSRVTETPQPDGPTAAPSPRRDVFVSHATEDKEAVARPLALELRQRGLSIWFDEYELVLGDSLREKIDEGLRDARIGVVILSPSFFAKRWTQWELNGLVTRLMAGERNVIVPIWYDVNAEAVREYSPALADLVAARASEGVASISDKIERVLRQVEARPQDVDSLLESERSTGSEDVTTAAASGLAAAREVEYLTEDMRRWIRDRDRVLQAAVARTREEMNARGAFHSSIHLAAQAEVRHQALHEYRDEISRKRRRYRELRDDAIEDSAFPRFELDDASRETLAGWRAPVTLPGMDQGLSVDDPTDPALEPDLREFERRGDRPEDNR